MQPLSFAVVGAGLRGLTHGGYLRRHPDEGRAISVAEPDPERLRRFADRHGIGPEGQFQSWEQLLEARPPAEAIVIATQDRMHVAPALQALSLGYHVLLEKPMSPDPAECLALADAAERAGRVLMVCHVLRYAPFFQAAKALVDNGRIGRLASLQWTENVGWFHQAHSFVRGNWRRSDEASPMILAKCCHDLDLIHWLVGAPCRQISSFGSLLHFRPEHAPPGATPRCTDGCPSEPDCPYSALRIYPEGQTDWPSNAISTDLSPEGRLRALREGPYGRCVYFCDNDVVDHQVVNLAFEGGVTAALTMTGFTADITRTFRLFGTHGELRGHLDRNEIEVTEFASGRVERIYPDTLAGGHGGGDDGLMRAFIRHVRDPNSQANLSPARVSAETHLLAFAAEESRVSGQTVDFGAYVSRLGG